MNWTIEWLYAIILTSFTGSILMIVWYLVGRVLERLGFTNIVFELLKVVMVFFFLPVSFIALKLGENYANMGSGYLFVQTEVLLLASRIFLVVWGIGSILSLTFFVRDVYALYKKEKDAIPCTNEVCTQFEEIYHNLGGKGNRITLYRSYHTQVPCVTGVLHQRLTLPMRKFSEEELQVIFTHEITHCLQQDVALKWFSLLMLVFHFFNPFAWLLFRNIQRWSEYACDFRACRALGGMKHYFTVIAGIATASSAGMVLSSGLFEGQNELLDRMKRMKKSSRVKYRSKLAAIFISFIAFFTSMVTVSAATLESVEQYEYLYHLTEVNIEEEYSNEIDYKNLLDSGIVSGIVTKVEIVSKEPVFEWSVAKSELMKTDSFSCVAGETVKVIVSGNPGDANFRVGLIEPSGNKRYQQGYKRVEWEFLISTDGLYQVFVENISDETVEVEGFYIIE